MFRKLLLILALLPVGVLTFAPGSKAREKAPKTNRVAQLGAPLANLVTRANARGFARIEARPGNTVFSPAGEIHAISPVALGAAGKTRETLAADYGLPATDTELVAALTGYLGDANRDRERYASQTGFLLSGDFPPRDTFAANLNKLPGTELISTKASSGIFFGLIGGSDGFDTGQAAVADWFKRNARLKLSADEVASLLPAPVSDDSTWVFSALNANHFKGEWALSFSTGQTAPRAFHTAPGTVEVPTMEMEGDGIIAGDMPWLEPGRESAGPTQSTHRSRWEQFDQAPPANPHHQYLKLRFKDKRHAMVFFLPKWGKEADGESPLAALATLEARLRGRALADTLEKIRDDGVPATVHVRLPKFSLRSEHALILAHAGPAPLTSPWVADFSPMSAAVVGEWLKEKNVVLGSARQICEVEIDEDGAKAASVSMVSGMSIGCAAGPGPEFVYDFIADHPFLFAIQDEQTGAVLFLGRVTHPAPGATPARSKSPPTHQ